METNKNTAPIVADKDRNAASLDLMHRMKLHGECFYRKSQKHFCRDDDT